MSETTGISWCDSTFQYWIGCTKVGPGCDHCYAETMDKRKVFQGETHWGAGVPRMLTSQSNRNKPLQWEKNHEAFFAANGHRRRVFCSSLADVFDNEVDPAWRADLFELIRKTPNLDWLLLTKRIGNVKSMLPPDWDDGYQNVWLGATVVNQEEADRDILKLLATPARIRFLSMEPLLGAVNLRRYFDQGTMWTYKYGVDWVIVGGESGTDARPMHPVWARSLRDQCKAAGTPFFFKQWGEWEISSFDNGHFDCDMARNNAYWVFPDGVMQKPSYKRAGFEDSDDIYGMVKVGKDKAGDLLDGIEHKEFPR